MLNLLKRYSLMIIVNARGYMALDGLGDDPSLVSESALLIPPDDKTKLNCRGLVLCEDVEYL